MSQKLRKITLITTILLFSIKSYCNLTTTSTDNQFNSLDSLKKRALEMAAREKFQQSRDIFMDILKYKKEKLQDDNHKTIADTYVNIGVIYKKQGYYDKSMEYYLKAERIYEKQDTISNRKLGSNYLNMANIFSLQKDKEKAELYYHKAISLLKKDSLENLEQLSWIYNNLGALYNNLGSYQKAVDNYKISLKIKDKSDSEGILNTMVNIANAYHKSDSNKIAEQYYKEIIPEAKKSYGENNYNLAKIYMNYGVLKLKQKSFTEAKELFNNSLKIYHSSLGDNHPETSKVFSNLGDLYYQQGELRKALESYQKGLIAISEEFNDTSLFANPRAENVFSKNELLELSKRKARKLEEWGEKNPRYYEEALKTYDLAIRTTREIRKGYINDDSKLLLTAEERDTYMEAMEIAIQLYQNTQNKKYLDKAFAYAEGSKATVLYESIQSNQALTIGNIPDSLKQKENLIKKRIHNVEELIFEANQDETPNSDKIQQLEDQLFQLNRSYETLMQTFEKDYPDFYELKYNLKAIKPEVIQEKMSNEDIIVEYAIFEEKLYTFMLEKNDLRMHLTPINDSLPQEINNLKNSISKRNFANHGKEDMKDFAQTAHYIYSKLIKPLNLPQNKKLIIIPDDQLAYIPFEILVTKPVLSDLPDYSSLRYLIHDYNISYDYSAKVLFTEPVVKKKSKKRFAGFAPSYENLENPDEVKIATRQKYRERLYPLKGIKKEVSKITQIINGDKFIDEDATEKNFKKHSSKYDMLHLAMHTIVSDDDPMFSKMAFTQTNEQEEDGFLNTYEIYNLNLSSRMTILSSCNTGIGKLSRGEGVMSLARGFKYAGCPSIVMTLWPVEDNASIQLMEYFYEEIIKGKSKEEALREAKIKFLNNADMLHAHPYFWSGYILIGDKEAIYNKNRDYLIGGILIIVVAGLIGRRYYMNRKKRYFSFK
ncbi:MAG: CHAT domain-containing protein [Bacteroidales bacterium]